ncbi:hypothetical protein Y032_0025g1099 [Ancylostoma ceylanicum]|uniref:SEA domain-containing protein n=1 Tax=Ancylostoma ceylanicum TaxID=53326 RepID=A0A016UW48_9BILA|nr:hypothetical protein Y032_0025g1099 [Ancylostoma ceylanicum]
MFHLLCSLLIVAIVEHVSSSPWEMVEVTLASEYYGNDTIKYALDDFADLFDEFAQQQGIRFHRGNFRAIATFINGLPVAKYGLRGVECEQFRQFLSGVKAQKYHLQYAAVRCGPMTFSFCMAFSCTPEDFLLKPTTTAAASGGEQN